MTDTGQPNLIGGLVALITMLLLSFLSYALVFHEIPVTNQPNFATLIGFVAGLATAVVSFYFGSSQNNKKLADTNATQAQTIAAAQAALTPDSSKTVNLAPNETATVTATENP